MSNASTYCRLLITHFFIFLLLIPISTLRAEVPERIYPLTFMENGLRTDAINFGYVKPGSFTQRYILIGNTSNHTLTNTVIRLTGRFTTSSCMSVFNPGDSCQVILNYRAPEISSWESKWLEIEFSVQQPNGMTHTDSQRIAVTGGVAQELEQTD